MIIMKQRSQIYQMTGCMIGSKGSSTGTLVVRAKNDHLRKLWIFKRISLRLIKLLSTRDDLKLETRETDPWFRVRLWFSNFFNNSKTTLHVFLFWDRSRRSLKHTNEKSYIFLWPRAWLSPFLQYINISLSHLCLGQLSSRPRNKLNRTQPNI